jgi:hypothetical protein
MPCLMRAAAAAAVWRSWSLRAAAAAAAALLLQLLWDVEVTVVRHTQLINAAGQQAEAESRDEGEKQAGY